MDHKDNPDKGKDTEGCEPMEQAKEDKNHEKDESKEAGVVEKPMEQAEEDKNHEKDESKGAGVVKKPTGIPALISDEPDEKQQEEDTGPKLLDLAFAMDCTGSMGSYIKQAQQNIRKIVEDIVSKEQADVRLALVEYRDHPPQDSTFVTRVHDFTSSVREMKTWLDACDAAGGGDSPEAVADALHQVLKLNWRQEAAKICVFISDAPPHGLGLDSGDGFPNGCPDGLDPMEIAGKLAEKSITIYLVGCEPSINRYKEFFMALAHITGGQYLPLNKAKLLSAVITGGAQEELSLQQLFAEVNDEVQQELEDAAEGSVEYDDLASRVHSKMKSRGHRTVQLQMNSANLPKATASAQELSYCPNMSEVRKKLPAAASSPVAHLPRRGKHLSASKKKASKGASVDGARSTSSEDEDDDEEIVATASLAPSAASRRVEEDSYGVVKDEEIAEEQVYRMVSRSLAANKLRSKTHVKKTE